MRRDLAGSGNSTVIFAQRVEESLRLSISGIKGTFLALSHDPQASLKLSQFHPENIQNEAKSSTQSNGLVC